VLAVTSVAVFMSFLDVTIVNIAFPDLRSHFAESSVATLSWVINGYGVVFAAVLVPAGRWADRVGRRRLFLAGVAGFVAASAVCALAPTPELLVAARVLQAVAAAAIVPTSLALLLPEFPLRRRATATAIWGATGAVAAAAGPALGGLLVAVADWRLVFVVNLPIGLAALLAARGLLTENRDPASTASPDWWGAMLLAVGVGALALGIVQGPDWGWSSFAVIGAAGVAVVALVGFVRRSARHPAPVVELGLFRIRSFAVANAGTVVFAVGFYALLLCNVLFLTGVWRYDIGLAGVALTPGAVMAALLAPFGGRAADRFGQRAVAVPGALLFAGGTAFLATNATATPSYAADLLPGMLLTGAGIGLSISSFGSAAVAELPRTRFATGSAITACFRQIGAVIGIAVLLAVVGAPDPTADAAAAFHSAWWLMAGTGLVAAGCAVALGRVRARDTALPSPTTGPASAQRPDAARHTVPAADTGPGIPDGRPAGSGTEAGRP
jgi:EmrB/QacA subfamily drug resistance transporter